jgi:hypothetical protein
VYTEWRRCVHPAGSNDEVCADRQGARRDVWGRAYKAASDGGSVAALEHHAIELALDPAVIPLVASARLSDALSEDGMDRGLEDGVVASFVALLYRPASSAALAPFRLSLALD